MPKRKESDKVEAQDDKLPKRRSTRIQEQPAQAKPEPKPKPVKEKTPAKAKKGKAKEEAKQQQQEEKEEDAPAENGEAQCDEAPASDESGEKGGESD